MYFIFLKTSDSVILSSLFMYKGFRYLMYNCLITFHILLFFSFFFVMFRCTFLIYIPLLSHISATNFTIIYSFSTLDTIFSIYSHHHWFLRAICHFSHILPLFVAHFLSFLVWVPSLLFQLLIPPFWFIIRLTWNHNYKLSLPFKNHAQNLRFVWGLSIS